MTLKSSIYRKSCGFTNYYIHAAWRMLWDYLVNCIPSGPDRQNCIVPTTVGDLRLAWHRDRVTRIRIITSCTKISTVTWRDCMPFKHIAGDIARARGRPYHRVQGQSWASGKICRPPRKNMAAAYHVVRRNSSTSSLSVRSGPNFIEQLSSRLFTYCPFFIS